LDSPGSNQRVGLRAVGHVVSLDADSVGAQGWIINVNADDIVHPIGGGTVIGSSHHSPDHVVLFGP
jgi:hypothetical protein